MSLTKLNGNQIKDKAILSNHINDGIINNTHIAQNANIDESKLNINWNNHKEALVNKKVVQLIQVNNTSVPVGISKIDLRTIFLGVNDITTIPHVNSADTAEGIICNSPKNKCILLDATTQEPIVAIQGNIEYEVFGRISWNIDHYELAFYIKSQVDGAELAYTFTNATIINWQYAQRFNLETVDEMFATGDKFVIGSADVIANLNIQQLAKDIYGPDYTLDKDGNPNLTINLSKQIQQEVGRAQAAETSIANQTTTEISRAQTAENTLQTNLNAEVSRALSAENTLQKNIDIEATRATNIENQLQKNIDAEVQRNIELELQSKQNIDQVNAKIDDFKNNLTTALGASAIGVDVHKGTLGPTVQDALDTHTALISSVIQEINSATGNETLAQKFNDLINKINAIQIESIHEHMRFVTNFNGQLEILLPAGQQFNMDIATNGIYTDPVSVSVNGVLQTQGIGYTLIPSSNDSSKGIGVRFAPDNIEQDDNIIIDWIQYLK